MSDIDDTIKRQKEKFDKFDEGVESSRKISRDTIFRLIILSASIVGFSVSLFSIPQFQSTLDVYILKYSWYCFLGVIILGFFVLFFEGRVKHAITWKGFQLSQHPEQKDDTLKERIFAFIITTITLFYPTNLLFNYHYTSDDERNFKERVNGLVVRSLARIKHELIFLENFVLPLFISGLILLVLSFNI